MGMNRGVVVLLRARRRVGAATAGHVGEHEEPRAKDYGVIDYGGALASVRLHHFSVRRGSLEAMLSRWIASV